MGQAIAHLSNIRRGDNDNDVLTDPTGNSEPFSSPIRRVVDRRQSLLLATPPTYNAV